MPISTPLGAAAASISLFAPAAASAAAPAPDSAAARVAPGTGRAAHFRYKVLANIVEGMGTDQVAVNQRTSTAYVTNPDDDTVSVISGRKLRLTATLNTNGVPFAIAVNPRTNTVYVSDISNPNQIWVISGRTDKLTATIGVSGFPGQIAVDPRTNMIYVTSQSGLEVISGRTNRVTATISLPAPAFGVAVNPRTDTIYATQSALAGGPGLTVINGRTPPPGGNQAGVRRLTRPGSRRRCEARYFDSDGKERSSLGRNRQKPASGSLRANHHQARKDPSQDQTRSPVTVTLRARPPSTQHRRSARNPSWLPARR